MQDAYHVAFIHFINHNLAPVSALVHEWLSSLLCCIFFHISLALIVVRKWAVAVKIRATQWLALNVRNMGSIEQVKVKDTRRELVAIATSG